jgi:hypothetical protein
MYDINHNLTQTFVGIHESVDFIGRLVMHRRILKICTENSFPGLDRIRVANESVVFSC